jgi:hypothetical protein
MKQLLCFLVGACLIFSGGCIPQIIDLSEFLPNQADDDQKQVEKYEGKVYLIGTLTGQLKEEFDAAMTFTDYVSGATDGAIVISSDAFGSLTQEQLDGFEVAFASRQPIILVQATAAQITAFGQQFLGESFTYTLPDGVEYAEVYAVDMEEGGHIWQWALYPPNLTDDEDSVEEQQGRLGELVDWLQENSTRMEGAEDATDEAAKAVASGNNELTQLVSAFVDQSNFSMLGNRYQITHFVYSCHSYDTGDDWFYVQQKCVLYGGGAYEKKKVKYNQETKGWYMDSIEIDSSMEGYENNPTAVGMIQSSPETENNKESATSGVNFSIGGDVGVASSGPSGKISAGVTITNSRTISILDCEVTNKSNDQANNAHWIYQFNKRCKSVSYALYAGLTDPPKLSINTFQPVNQWIWRVQPELRTKKTPMHVKLDIFLCWTRGVIDFWWATHADHTRMNGGFWEYDVNIPYPPNTAK